MDLGKISELLGPFLGANILRETQLNQVAIYLDLLAKWNARINLTAIRNPEEVVTRHFGESFFAARHLAPNPDSAASAIDIGSGAGFPGIPLKIWGPGLNLTLIESSHKKAVFLREVARAIDSPEIRVVTQRAESIQALADLVALRAVEHFETILPVAARLTSPGGLLALLIGAEQVAVATSCLPQFEWLQPLQIPLSRERVLLRGKLARG